MPLRLLLLSLSVSLAACAGQGSADASPETPMPEAPAASTTEAAVQQVPADVLGTFDATPAACAEALTMARLTLTPDSLLFYYGYATVGTVTRRADGYDVEATLVQLEGQVEVVPEPAAYRIEPAADGGLRFDVVGTGQPAEALVRCAAR